MGVPTQTMTTASAVTTTETVVTTVTASTTGSCCWGAPGATCATMDVCQGGWCGGNQGRCEEGCNGMWCPRTSTTPTTTSMGVPTQTMTAASTVTTTTVTPEVTTTTVTPELTTATVTSTVMSPPEITTTTVTPEVTTTITTTASDWSLCGHDQDCTHPWGLPTIFTTACLSPALGCNAMGLMCCRYCGFGVFEGIECSNSGSVTTETAAPKPLI